MTDTEREALCARIDELCAEVEALKRDEWSAGFNAGCDAVNAAIEDGKAHYEVENAKLRDEVERLRQENQSIGMAAYEVGYKDASAHYELEHCPACKNIADLQEALEENAKLRECLQDLAEHIREDDGFGLDYGWMLDRMRELGIEVPA